MKDDGDLGTSICDQSEYSRGEWGKTEDGTKTERIDFSDDPGGEGHMAGIEPSDTGAGRANSESMRTDRDRDFSLRLSERRDAVDSRMGTGNADSFKAPEASKSDGVPGSDDMARRAPRHMRQQPSARRCLGEIHQRRLGYSFQLNNPLFRTKWNSIGKMQTTQA